MRALKQAEPGHASVAGHCTAPHREQSGASGGADAHKKTK